MRFLIDAQLPPALSQLFNDDGHSAEHVFDIGLAEAADEEIWNEAARRNAVIVTKDEDFVARLPLRANVSIVWIRIGNCSNRILREKLRPLLPEIGKRLQQGERLIEVI